MALNCAYCKSSLNQTFVNLGMGPLVSSYLLEEQLGSEERFYPLHSYVCGNCWLVQLPQAQPSEELFSSYPYFSSYSESWLAHAKAYVESITNRFDIGMNSLVIEVASNDGYLLQYVKGKGVPVLGIEPAANVAQAALADGISTVVRFFGTETARQLVNEGKRADLLIGNNVLAHVPDIHDFVAGAKILLKERGVITMEFPHLLKLMDENQFDTIFHEHFSYLSLLFVQKAFQEQGLTIFDCEEIMTHGGSLRIYAKHSEDGTKAVTSAVDRLIEAEVAFGMKRLDTYAEFCFKVHQTKRELLRVLLELKSSNRSIVAYGAAGKGCILLNYCGIRDDIVDYVVDLSLQKQGKYMPGVHLPIFAPPKIQETKPDYVFILPWNLKNEIMRQMDAIRNWGGKFIVPIPSVKIYP